MYTHVYNKMYKIIYFRRIIKEYILAVGRVLANQKPKTIEAKINININKKLIERIKDRKKTPK